jgi:hypothetical protein
MDCAGVIAGVAAVEILIAVGAGALLIKAGGVKGLAALASKPLGSPAVQEFLKAALDIVDLAIHAVPKIGRFAAALIYDHCRPAQVLLNSYLGIR